MLILAYLSNFGMGGGGTPVPPAPVAEPHIQFYRRYPETRYPTKKEIDRERRRLGILPPEALEAVEEVVEALLESKKSEVSIRKYDYEFDTFVAALNAKRRFDDLEILLRKELADIFRAEVMYRLKRRRRAIAILLIGG